MKQKSYTSKFYSTGENIVLIEGARTPFLKSNTEFEDLQSHDLARFAIKGLMDRVEPLGFTPNQVQYCVMGTVIQEVKTSNIAREALIGAGKKKKTKMKMKTKSKKQEKKKKKNTIF